jgi:pSer/pThr/pTyr-binding forkhead associated (FHA) protein
MPVTGANNPTTSGGSAAPPHFSSATPIRSADTGNAPTSSTTFLERHGHTPMNIDVQVLATQNTARRRAESSPVPVTTTITTTAAAAATPGGAPTTSSANDGKASIRIVPAMDSFTRVPLRFDPIYRKVDDGEVLVVGRHTDRLVNEHPTAVVFRSKVVSRNHAKMWCKDGQWYVQDVGSSSGTFLNHIRLSPPNVESTPYAIKTGDIVQLGIDFRVSSPFARQVLTVAGWYGGSVQMCQDENRNG